MTPSPRESDSDSSDSGGESDTTLDDGNYEFGHPLQRMVHLEPFDRTHSFSSTSSTSSASTSSSVSYDLDFELLVDELLAQDPYPVTETRNFVMVEPSSPGSDDAVMIKCLPRSSPELLILLELNQNWDEVRQDPWNPAPRLLCAVERQEEVFLCMEKLIEYDHPPFKTVANLIDFFKQILEGLTFLHERKVVNLCYEDDFSTMMDIGRYSPAEFDRARYPVRYYHVDFSRAEKLGTDAGAHSMFQKDVQECGRMIDRLLINVPRIAVKFKALTNAMSTGDFGADDARKLFEARCKSLEASTFGSLLSSG